MDRAVKLIDVKSGELRATWTDHSQPVYMATFSPDGRWLASAAGDWQDKNRPGEIIIREIPSGRVHRTLRGHNGIAWAVAFSPDGRLLATGGGEYRTPNQEVILWDMATGLESRRFPNLPGGVGWRRIHTGRAADHRVRRQGDPGLGGRDGTSGRTPFTAPGSAAGCLALSPDGRWVVSGGEDPAGRRLGCRDGEQGSDPAREFQ